jgi:hypothetical protein
MPQIDALSSQGQAAVKGYVVVKSTVASELRNTVTLEKTTTAGAAYSGLQDFTIDAGGGVQNSRYDPVIAIGYNVDVTSAVKNSGDVSAGWWTEADYDTGTKRLVEFYCQYHPAVGTEWTRPFFAAVDRATGRTTITTIMAPSDTTPMTIHRDTAKPDNTNCLVDISVGGLVFYPQDGTTPARVDIRGRNKAGTGALGGVLNLGHTAVDNVFSLFPIATTIVEAQMAGQRWWKGYILNTGSNRIGNLSLGQDNNSALLSVSPGGLGWDSMPVLEVRKGTRTGSYALRITEDGGTVERFVIDTNWNVEIGQKANLATSATNGFPYIPVMTDQPSGTPSAKTGLRPLVIEEDTANGQYRLWSYLNGAWRGVNLVTSP